MFCTFFLVDMDHEIENLEKMIRIKERWESVESMRKDDLVEEGTYEATLLKTKGGEMVRTGVVVGAEKERERLEIVIIKRAGKIFLLLFVFLYILWQLIDDFTNI